MKAEYINKKRRKLKQQLNKHLNSELTEYDINFIELFTQTQTFNLYYQEIKQKDEFLKENLN